MPQTQDRAIAPAPPGRRKVVLATSIAETSLTIEGVRVVIDCGLARVPRYEPDVGLTRLETVRVSRAAADQRRGRAGRTEPGVCYRLWDEPQTASLEAYARPEILAADLSGFVLDLAHGASPIRRRSPSSIRRRRPRSTEAKALLTELGAIDATAASPTRAASLRALPLPPRLARMVVDAAARGRGRAGRRHRRGPDRARPRRQRRRSRRIGSSSFAATARAAREDARAHGEALGRIVRGQASPAQRRERVIERRRAPGARLSGSHRQEPRRGRRVPAGQRPRRQCRPGLGAGARAVPRGRRTGRHRRARPHPAGRADHARRDRGALRRSHRDAARRSRSTPRSASLRGAPQRAGSARSRWPSSRCRSRRTTRPRACSPRASSRSASTGCRGPRRCSNGATA